MTLNIYGGVHQRADINRQHAPQNKDGRGLRKVEYAFLSEQIALQEYVNKRLKEPLIYIFSSGYRTAYLHI